MSDSEQIKDKTRELFELKEQLKAIGKDTKLLRDRVKNLTQEIGQFMSTQDVDSVSVKGVGKVSQKVGVKKAPFNRASVKLGLATYFGGDETAVEGAMTAIEDNLPQEESTSVTARASAKA
jgi:2,3-bisphosphoglycerate-independent phosphoglycerate mutase